MRLYDAIDMPRQLYLIMENVHGKMLSDVLRDKHRKPLTEITVARIFDQLIAALVVCHAESIAHRDLKPENIMVDMSNEE